MSEHVPHVDDQRLDSGPGSRVSSRGSRVSSLGRDPRPDRRGLHALLAGGGTGGHVYPALAVADALLERGWQVTFCGRPDSFEAAAATRHGLPFAPLPASPLVGRGMLGKGRALARLSAAAVGGRRLVRRLDADIVVGTGGYVSAPAVLGGRLAGRPALLLELNAVAGVANRWLSRWAQEAAVAWPNVGDQLRCPITVTGVPVRRDFQAAAETEARAPGPPWRLLVLGGSQGARQLNRLLPAAFHRVAREAGGLQVLHQCGADHLQATREAYGDAAPDVQADVVPYVDDVARAMAGAHLVVSRAGAVTLAELAAAGRPAVLIPLASAGGHQGDNARAHVRAGAASAVFGVVSPEELAAILIDLLGSPEQLESMARAARRLARPDAARAVVERIEAVAGGSGAGMGGRT